MLGQRGDGGRRRRRMIRVLGRDLRRAHVADLVVGKLCPVVEVWVLDLGNVLLPITAHLGV